MLKKMGRIFFILLLILKPALSDIRMQKIEFDEKNVGFFKAITDFIIIDDKLIIADFFSNRVLSYKYLGGKAVFLNTIGRPGQGPGDIQKPLALSAFGDRIAIKDQESISIFSADAMFISKFRQFASFTSFLMENGRIYYLGSNPASDFSISVFDTSGKWLFDMMRKRLWQNSGEVTQLNSFRERLIYDGCIMSDGKYLYFISRHFGFIEKYSLSGELLLKRELGEELGDNAKAKLNENKKKLIHSDILKLDKGSAGCYELFSDCCLDGEYIYILMSQYDLNERKPLFKIDIRRINASDLNISSSYLADLKGEIWLSKLRVKTIKQSPVFLINPNTDSGQELYELHIEK